MAYIGNTQQNQNYVPAIDYFSGNGSTVAFTLSRPVASVAQVQAVIENVPQNPGDAYTVSGNTITFTSAPPSGTNNIYVYYTNLNTSVVTPPQDPTIYGSLQFNSTGARIRGDFSNATIANRLIFQTSTTNGNTFTGFIPNGSSTTAGVVCYANSDPTNASSFSFSVLSSEARLNSSLTGTGTYLPMTFYTSGGEKMRIDTSGNVGIGTSSPGGRLHARWDAGAGDSYTGKFVFSSTDQALFIKTYWESGIGQHTTLEASNLANSAVTDLRLNGNTLQLQTGGTERMRITAAGGIAFGGAANFGTSGQFLRSNGDAAPTWATPSGGFTSMQVYTSGVNTWTVPAGITKVKVTVVGGGGGGGNGTGANGNRGSGGGGGGAAIKIISGLTPGETVTVTVGGGGGAVSGGGTSSFGTHCSATGGGAGITNAAFNSPRGGLGSNGDLNFYGDAGAIGGTYNAGGGSFLSGISYNPTNTVPGAGTAGNAYGGGGGGAYTTTTGTQTGGAGAAGVVIIEY